MSESRWRPLVAFALVSLLCAVILAINIDNARPRGVVTAHQAGHQPATSRVVFGDVLAPRQTQAGSSLGASLSGVAPVPAALASTTPRVDRQASQRSAHRKSGRDAHRDAHHRTHHYKGHRTHHKATHHKRRHHKHHYKGHRPPRHLHHKKLHHKRHHSHRHFHRHQH